MSSVEVAASDVVRDGEVVEEENGEEGQVEGQERRRGKGVGQKGRTVVVEVFPGQQLEQVEHKQDGLGEDSIGVIHKGC